MLDESFVARPPEAGWSYRRENARGRAGSSEARLLRWPYPYRAALAVSNDTDGMSLAALADMHDFLNGTGETRYGRGLGLEVGNSFWIWNEHGQLSLRHGMPAEPGLQPSPESEILAELGRAGWLDTLHGFGAWSRPWRLGRHEAEQGLALLTELRMKPTVYINHGGSSPLHGGGGSHMTHNIGGPWGWYQRGDVPDDPSYCLDLLREFGFQFFWADPCYELTRFGEDRTYRNQRSLDLDVAQHDFQRWFRRRPPGGKGEFQAAFSEIDQATTIALRQRFFNHLQFPVEMRDGCTVTLFKRFRGLSAPTSGNFAAQVPARLLDELEQAEAGVVIYQHFGIWRPLGADRIHGHEQRSRPPVFDTHSTWIFREIARRQDAGRLFVTTTSRLLQFAWVRDNLVWSSETLEDGALVIALRNVRCPAEGPRWLAREMLDGVSFTVPRSCPDVRLEVTGMKEPPRLERHQFSIEPDLDVVVVPWRRLSYDPIGDREGYSTPS